MNLGERIAMLRGRRSQASVAAAAGIDVMTLNRIETGKVLNPSRTTLAKLAPALGVSLAVLMDESASIVLQTETESRSRGARGGVSLQQQDEIRELYRLCHQLRDLNDGLRGRVDSLEQSFRTLEARAVAPPASSESRRRRRQIG